MEKILKYLLINNYFITKEKAKETFSKFSKMIGGYNWPQKINFSITILIILIIIILLYFILVKNEEVLKYFKGAFKDYNKIFYFFTGIGMSAISLLTIVSLFAKTE